MGNSAISKKLNVTEWKHQIEESRQNKFNASDDYELLIQYLVDPQTTSNDIISNITRIIRCYITKLTAVTLCDFNEMDIEFEGVKVSIAIHPLNGDIYIADEYNIFKWIKKNTLELIATIPQRYLFRDRPRITDLTFHSNGDTLFCLLNNELKSVYRVFYNDHNKSVNKRIIESMYDEMDVFKYDFNHYYLTDTLIEKLFPMIQTSTKMDILCVSRIWPNATLYVPDFYRKEMWLLKNNGTKQSPLLYRIGMDQNRNIYETINLYDDIENFLENEYRFDDPEHKYILAFDVDKYYGAIYFVRNNKCLYRIEKVNKEWKITHKVLLKDVLENNLPVGIHTIRYDSVIGRVIVADNYKIQSIYL